MGRCMWTLEGVGRWVYVDTGRIGRCMWAQGGVGKCMWTWDGGRCMLAWGGVGTIDLDMGRDR